MDYTSAVRKRVPIEIITKFKKRRDDKFRYLRRFNTMSSQLYTLITPTSKRSESSRLEMARQIIEKSVYND